MARDSPWVQEKTRDISSLIVLPWPRHWGDTATISPFFHRNNVWHSQLRHSLIRHSWHFSLIRNRQEPIPLFPIETICGVNIQHSRLHNSRYFSWVTNCQEHIPPFSIETIPRYLWIHYSRHFQGTYLRRIAGSDSTGILKFFADMPLNYSAYIVVPLCAQLFWQEFFCFVFFYIPRACDCCSLFLSHRTYTWLIDSVLPIFFQPLA